MSDNHFVKVNQPGIIAILDGSLAGAAFYLSALTAGLRSHRHQTKMLPRP